MAKRHKKARSLRRRYGHFAVGDVKKLAKENPLLAAAVIGSAAGAAAAAGGMGLGASALVGAGGTIAAHELTK
jgi:hypothetical protein